MQLTEKQQQALNGLADGGGLIPSIHFAALRDGGLVEKAPEGHTHGSRRGFSAAVLTAEGRKRVFVA